MYDKEFREVRCVSKIENHPVLIKENVLKHLFYHRTLGKKFVARILSIILDIDEQIITNNIKLSWNGNLSDYNINKVINATFDKKVMLINFHISYYQNKDNELNILWELSIDKIKEKNINLKNWGIIEIYFYYHDVLKQKRFIYQIGHMEKRTDLEINDLVEKYYFNLSYLINNFDKDDMLMKSVYFLICSDKKVLNDLYQNDQLIQRILYECKKFGDEEEISVYYNLERNKINEYHQEDYFWNILNYGELKEKKQMVLNLYDNGITIGLIARSIGISILEVKRIIEKRN